MKKVYQLSLNIIFTVSTLLAASAQYLEAKLTKLQNRYNFEFEALNANNSFGEKYVIYFEQPTDHNNPQNGTFWQRIFISHRDANRPIVLITEGYDANYASHPNYVNELSDILDANQVCVEHRYFGESVPKPLNWTCLTTFQAASDHHRITLMLKEIYSGAIVNTGISKGGQTAMYHRYYFPNDVAATVGYVCPLNFSIADARVYKFLNEVGDSLSRKKVLEYQIEMLSKKVDYLPAFEKMAQRKNLTYSMGIEKAYELTVLEYAFAFWQWGTTSPDSIPMYSSNPDYMIAHLDKIAGIDWISNEGIDRLFPFFYQAMTEVGFYGYDISPFSEYVSFTENPTFNFTIPDSILYSYNPEPMQNVDCFLRHEADKMIFIYGESDPWSATAVDITYNNDVIKVEKPGGSHLTRISNLPESQKQLVINTLKSWLNIH